MLFTFMTNNQTDSVLDYLAASEGELSLADLHEMLNMCQIATCHERGERYVRQVGHYVARGGVLRLSAADARDVTIVDDLDSLRELILRRDGALDIASDPCLLPAHD